MADVPSCPEAGQLRRLLEDLLTERDQLDLNAHLADCASCQQRLDELIAEQGFRCDVARHLQSAQSDVEPGTATRFSARAGEAPDQADDDLTLEFLAPSEKPESLGRLGHYEVLEVIGRGGMGIVLRAFDEKLHRVVAIKVMAPRLAATSPPRKRFLREARAAAQVRHEHVVDIHAVEEQPIPHLVMEYVPGESLQQRLNRIGPLEVPDVLRIGQQIARGLAAAHAQGLIHRDVKPGNILLEKGIEERVKITDFGLARAADDASLTQSGLIAGTPLYMAPEQAQGTAIDHRADLFSLGSVLYTMASGRPPFRAPTSLAVLKRVVEDTPRPIQEIIPEVPSWLCAIIARLHAKRPEDRFQSAKEVADVLGQCLTRPAGAPEPKPVLPVPDSKPQVEKPTQSAIRNRGTRASGSSAIAWRPWLIAAAALLVLLCVLSLSEAIGVTQVTATVIRLLTPEGTLVVETNDPAVKVTIEGDGGLSITGAGPQEVRLRPGKYQVQATMDGKPVTTKLVEITRGDRKVVTVTHAPTSQAPAGVPQLLTPAAGALLPNGAKDGSKQRVWEFSWTAVPAATRYHIFVIGPTASIPSIDTISLTEPSFRLKSTEYVGQQFVGWRWKVRAMVAGNWMPWSEERTFDVEPAAPGAAKTGLAPFVVLGRDAVSERTFDTLADAVSKSSDGDTIEIRGNGPFESVPISIQSRSLTIRAATGFVPVVRLSPKELSGAPLLQTTGVLVLEGLDLQLLGFAPPQSGSKPPCHLTCRAGSHVYIANCRFISNPVGQSLFIEDGKLIDVRNSELIRAPVVGVCQQFVAANSIFANSHLGFAIYWHTKGSLRLARNTLVGRVPPIQFIDDIADDDPNRLAKFLDCECTGNIFDGQFGTLNYAPRSGPRAKNQLPALQKDTALLALRNRVNWIEANNRFPTAVPLVNANLVIPSSDPLIRTLAAWNEFWGMKETGSTQGVIRYEGGDVRTSLLQTPEKLRPADFRPSPDSAHDRAAEDGKDLGPDIDLVGPGEAYERWKTTPDYQQWLKETGQAK